MKIVGIKRDAIFSPNSVEKDRMILQQVLDGLGDSIKMIDEKMLTSEENADVYVSMARHSTTLELLKEKEKEGALIINSAYSVERCERGWLNEAMRIEGLPIPDSEGKEGYWLKRGDMSAQSKADVVYCKDRAALANQQASFVIRGVTNWIVQAHIPGDLVKFYGVRGGFFRYYYPNDDGISKFGDEELNGEAHHYDFDVMLYKPLQNVFQCLRAWKSMEVTPLLQPLEHSISLISTTGPAFHAVEMKHLRPSFII